MKEPTRTQRSPSAPQLQGVIASVSEEDRATATLCLSPDAARPDWLDYKSGQSTESWKCEERDTKSTQSLGTSSAQVPQPEGVLRLGHA